MDHSTRSIVANFLVYRIEEANIQRKLVWSDNCNKKPLKTITIRCHDDFFIGRNAENCREVLDDSTISNKHVRISCISLGLSCNGNSLQSLVYLKDISRNGSILKRANSIDSSTSNVVERLTGGSEPALLNDNDEVLIGSSILLVFKNCELYTWKFRMSDALQAFELQMIRKQYEITDRVLGQGGYGNVLVARCKATQKHVACKIVSFKDLKRNLNLGSKIYDFFCSIYTFGNHSIGLKWLHVFAKKLADWLDDISKLVQKHCREFELLLTLDHPNIVRMEKVFRSSRTTYIFQELVTGGDLFSFVEYKGGKLEDVEAAIIVRQVLMAVEYLHNVNIVHRDLKPDNILLTSRTLSTARVVLTDFGHAIKLRGGDGSEGNGNGECDTDRMFSIDVGTFEYAAPETYGRNKATSMSQGYSKSVDIWSVGALTAMLLTGKIMFSRDSRSKISQENDDFLVRRFNYIDNGLDWKEIGTRPKEFVKSLLRLDETSRPTASQALKDPWFNNKLYGDYLDLLYSRSIKHWKARPSDSSDKIEYLEVKSDLKTYE